MFVSQLPKEKQDEIRMLALDYCIKNELNSEQTFEVVENVMNEKLENITDLLVDNQ